MKKIITLAVLAMSCSASLANEVAKGFNCPSHLPPDKVLKNFIAGGILDKKAFDSTDMIPTYEARRGFTAFGYPLVAVSGWSQDSKFFSRGPGTAPPTNITLIVQANAWQVKDAMSSMNVDVSRTGGDSYPHIIVEQYSSNYQEALPQGARDSAAYTRVSCYPRP